MTTELPPERPPVSTSDPSLLQSWRHGLEWDRKGIHLLSTALAVWTFYVSEPLASGGIVVATCFVLAVDLSRLRSRRWAVMIYRLLPFVFRRDERRSISGASIMMLGIAATSLLFPARPATAGILCLAWGDSAAALVGQFYKHWRYVRELRGASPQTAPVVRRRGGKTTAGTLGCFVVSMLMILLVVGPQWSVVVAGGAVAALLERWTPGRWDNLTVPVGAATVVLLLAGV